MATRLVMAGASSGSPGPWQFAERSGWPGSRLISSTDATKPNPEHFLRTKEETAMIYMLAAAMTLAMLIGTAFALRDEGEHIRVEERRRQQAGRFGRRF
jgi:hypothetical protein